MEPSEREQLTTTRLLRYILECADLVELRYYAGIAKKCMFADYQNLYPMVEHICDRLLAEGNEAVLVAYILLVLRIAPSFVAFVTRYSRPAYVQSFRRALPEAFAILMQGDLSERKHFLTPKTFENLNHFVTILRLHYLRM